MKYRDLPSDPGPSVVLRCECCDADYSANRSDYWDRLHLDATCVHCGEPMVVRERVRSYRKLRSLKHDYALQNRRGASGV